MSRVTFCVPGALTVSFRFLPGFSPGAWVPGFVVAVEVASLPQPARANTATPTATK